MTKRDMNGTGSRTGNDIQGDAPSGSNADPYGDDQGTRVGKPSTPDRDNTRDNAEPSRKSGTRGEQGGATGAGNEAAAGIHGKNDGGNAKRPGSEPLDERKNEHKSGYGGEGGAPRTSSDQR